MRTKATILATVLTVIASPCFAQREQIDPYLRNEMTSRRIPGLAAAVIQDSRPVYRQAFGKANHIRLELTPGTILFPNSFASRANWQKAAEFLGLLERALEPCVEIQRPLV